MLLTTIDLFIVTVYAAMIIAVAQWVSRERSGHEKNPSDYFLAGKALPWWAIGASLIAANISAEQIIGMSGAGFAIGLGIASYEWMAALTLIIVGKYFLPIFLEQRIYTMPQYLEQRYDHRVRMVMAVFWVALYVFVNLTAVLWLGALAIETIAVVDKTFGLLMLGTLAIAYSLYGGLKAVALTDIIQVVLLVLGGFIVTWLALDRISDGAGALAGFNEMTSRLPEKFDMILSPDNPHYQSLPGISVLVGGMWIMNLSYWGFNQYIIQRALAAKSIDEAQKGIVLAAALKLLMPVLVVLPGIAAVILAPDLSTPDRAYPEMMKLVPSGLRGLVFAALIAAILSSLGSMMNSVSTIVTMDLYKPWRPRASERQLVIVGRFVSVTAIVIAMIAAQPLLGQFDQAFQYIQEFTGFFTPGIVVLFLLGLFWPRATARGALVAAMGSFVLSAACWKWWPSLPFMDRVGLVFLACMALAIAVSLLDRSGRKASGTEPGSVDFRTSRGFNAAGMAVVLVLAALYAAWW